jgi:hypothetical protein
MNAMPTSPLGIVGDTILIGSCVAIGFLEVRRHRRLARARRERAAAMRVVRSSYAGPLRRRTDHGQAAAEFALVSAIMLPLMLAATQVALLLAYNLAQTNATATLAGAYAAMGPGPAFDAVVQSEATRLDCEEPTVQATEPEPGVVVVALHCRWYAPLYRDASWPVATQASAYLPGPTPEPAPTPEPSPVEAQL